MEYASTMQDLIEKILRLAEMSEDGVKAGDAWWAGNCTSEARGMAAVLGLLGIDYDFGAYTDGDYHRGDYHRIGHFSVDGVVLIKCGWVDWKACEDAAKEHHWSSRALTVTERKV